MVKNGILWLDSCKSTNDEAASHLGDSGIRAVAAGHQTAGRGRAGRSWHSPPGAGLYLSWIGQPRFPQSLGGLVPLMAAVTVAEVCDTLGVEVQLKWPNDVLVNGRKLAGILCEARGTPQAWTVIVGVGLNIQEPPNGFPEEIPGVALSELTESPLETTVIAEALTRGFERHMTSMEHAGGSSIIDAWGQRGIPVGTLIRRGSLEGRFAGLTREGALRLEAEDGIHEVHAGDVEMMEKPEE